MNLDEIARISKIRERLPTPINETYMYIPQPWIEIVRWCPSTNEFSGH